jgi:flagellar hook-associated protein 2
MALAISSILNYASRVSSPDNVLQSRYVKTSRSFQDSAYTKISTLGKLMSSLEKLKDSLKGIKIDSLKVMTTKVADESVLSAAAYSSAIEGDYSVKVSNIARSHILASKTYAHENSPVGTGTLTLSIASNVGVDIDITESRNSLARVKEVLNEANAGVNARLVKETNGYRLELSAKDSGESNKINIVVSDDDLNNADSNGLSALVYDKNGARNLAESTKPLNATLFADSSFYDKTSNKVTDAVTGVTMTLLKESQGYPVTVTVTEDSNAFIFKKLDSFISAYNDTVKLIDDLQGNTGVLKGDSSVGYLKNTLAEIKTKTYNDSTLKSFGFKFDTKGIMSLDIGKMDSAIQSNFANVTASINALADEMEKTVDDYINSVIPGQQDNYRSLINAYVKAEKQASSASKASSLSNKSFSIRV